jgi:hypothetical protein
MNERADLHIHTTCSDGALGAAAVVARARQAGLTCIAITDHDHVGAIDEARAAGTQLGIEVIAGVELSTTIAQQDVHLLGYLIDPAYPPLQEYLATMRAERMRRAERMVEKLNGLSVPLTMHAVLEEAGTAAVGRPHIATALAAAGLTESYYEAFSRYIGFGRPAYEEKVTLTPRESIRLIAEAGGISCIAHPGASIPDSLLRDLIHAGVDGIETVHPSHTPERTAYYRAIAEAYFLLTCGGSDYHGGGRSDEEALGKFTIPLDQVRILQRRVRQR